MNLSKDFTGHVFAMYLLAEFNEREALEPILQYLISSKVRLGSYLECDISRIIGTLALFEDIEKITSIVENTSLNIDNRIKAREVLLSLYINGKCPHDELEKCYKTLLQNFIDRDVPNMKIH